MTKSYGPLVAAASALLLSGFTAVAPLSAQTVLRLDEHAIGEIDPAKATDYADSMIFYNIYDTLVIPAAGGTDILPHLAESWTIDGQTYTFTLRDDVHFHSGNVMDSADVAFSIERMLALGQGFSSLFAGVIDSVATPDARTVSITLKQPYAPFVGSLVRLAIVDKDAVLENLADGDHGDLGDYGQAYLSSTTAGTGAYTISSHNPQELTVMVKNPDYFLGVPAAAPDTVELQYSIEPATLRALITRGELDIGDQWMAPEIKAAVSAEEGVSLGQVAGISSFYLKLNNQRAPLDDVHCRRAFALAYDYDAILEQTQVTDEIAFGRRAHGPLPLGVLGSDEAIPAGQFDLDAARAELEMCQYDPAEHEIQLNWVAGNPIQERIQLMMQLNLGELGFDTTITTTPWAMFTELAATAERTPHVSPVNFILTTPDPDSMLYTMYHSDAVGTWASVDWVMNEEVDRMIEAGRTETDPATRATIYRDLGNMLVEDQVSIFAYELVGVFPIRDVVHVPALQDEGRTYSVQGMNFMFREMTMN